MEAACHILLTNPPKAKLIVTKNTIGKKAIRLGM